MKETKSNLLQNILLIGSLIISLYPFISGLEKTWKIIGVIFGGIGVWYYLQYLFKEWITEEVLDSDKMEEIKQDFKQKYNEFKEEISYVKGWMNALNHWHKDKKGKSKGMDPITLIMIIIVVIIIILILKGRI